MMSVRTRRLGHLSFWMSSGLSYFPFRVDGWFVHRRILVLACICSGLGTGSPLPQMAYVGICRPGLVCPVAVCSRASHRHSLHVCFVGIAQELDPPHWQHPKRSAPHYEAPSSHNIVVQLPCPPLSAPRPQEGQLQAYANHR